MEKCGFFDPATDKCKSPSEEAGSVDITQRDDNGNFHVSSYCGVNADRQRCLNLTQITLVDKSNALYRHSKKHKHKAV